MEHFKLIKTKLTLNKDVKNHEGPRVSSVLPIKDASGQKYDMHITYSSGVIRDVDSEPWVYLYGKVPTTFILVDDRDQLLSGDRDKL